ncbi:hypothetical protein GGR56DRAFT_442404 [Xylariaceae sp. FL0804]|nr:hypothetical protein GGR56DRAFT_442404 [Xylariaceae sp. FL0804]
MRYRDLSITVSLPLTVVCRCLCGTTRYSVYEAKEENGARNGLGRPNVFNRMIGWVFGSSIAADSCSRKKERMASFRR